MSDFKIAVALTLQHEGGFVDNPADPGGATNMGVEQRDVPNTPIHTLTVAQAEAYYQANYWKPLYSQIEVQDIASKLFDMGVLFGVGTTVKILQKVVGVLPVDGGFGPMTLAVVNLFNPSQCLSLFKTALKAHAVQVVAAKPTEAIFLQGWDARIDS